MKAVCAVFLLVLLVCSHVAANETDSCDPLVVPRLLGVDVVSMEEQGQIDPDLSALLGDARINVYIDQCISHVVTVGGVVTEVGVGELPDNTVNVFTDTGTADAMEAGELTFLQAYDAKRIRIEGEGFVESLKFAIADFLYNLSKLLG